MRQWFTKPEIMCRKHLLGEHVEHHMFCGQIGRKRGISGYAKNNCVQPRHIKMRHDALVQEMINRGMNHKTPIESNPDISYLPETIQNTKVDVYKSTVDLISRCPICKQKALEYLKQRESK